MMFASNFLVCGFATELLKLAVNRSKNLRSHFGSSRRPTLASHDEVRAVKVKGHATMCDVEAGRSSHLFKRGNEFADLFAKKGADAHKPPFRIAKTMVTCASLALQAARWAAETHVLLRLRGWDDTKASLARAYWRSGSPSQAHVWPTKVLVHTTEGST